MPRDNGERVVTGARNLSPFLGSRMLATRFLDKAVFIRELLPQDLKLEIEYLSEKEAMKIAEFLAYTVGRGHSRQLDAADRRAWCAELQQKRSKSLDAPGWLWSSIVDLVSTGRTLKDNGLVETSVIMKISARLIVNRAALKTDPRVGALVEAFRALVSESVPA